MSSLARPHDVQQSAQDALIAGLVQLRPISIDDWSDVRYVHGSAFRTLIGPHVAPTYVDEFMTALGEPEYVDRFGGSNLTGAWLNGELAGTVGWRPSASYGRVARIEGLFVQPLFTFMGLGSSLLAHAELEAQSAGFSSVTVLATSHSLPFFMRLGYDIYVQGAGLAHGAGDLPMFLMRKQDIVSSSKTVVLRSGLRRSPETDAPTDAGLPRRPLQAPERVLAED